MNKAILFLMAAGALMTVNSSQAGWAGRTINV
jgi:hypothetical protein